MEQGRLKCIRLKNCINKTHPQLRNSVYSLVFQYNKLTYKLPVKKASIQYHSIFSDTNNNSNIYAASVRALLSWCGEVGQEKVIPPCLRC